MNMGQPEATTPNGVSAPHNGEPPPAYDESIRQHHDPASPSPTSSLQPPPNASPITQTQPPQSPIPRQFPTTFNIYRQSNSRRYITGQHQSQPIYAFSLHSGLTDSAPVILHSGPDETFPPMATVEWKVFSPTYYVSLPPPPGSAATAAEEKIEWVSRSHNHGTSASRFSIEVGASNVREPFEWRYSTSDAIARLGAYKGWKLVRETHGPPGGEGEDVEFIGGGFTDSEGHEIVAVLAELNGRGMKAATFQFMGTGDTGLLGERWAILAVMTGFATFYKAMRHRRD